MSDPRDLFISGVRALYDHGGHITRPKVAALLAALDAPAPPPVEPPPVTPPPVEPPPVNPPVKGFPDASTTGVPAGVELVTTGSLVITQDGAVIDGRRINGSVKVQANNVTIRRSVINSTALYPVQIGSEHTGLLIEDSEIDGNGKASVAILKGGYTLRRVNIHDVKDGPRVEGNDVLIEDCYIHDLQRVEGGHHDTIQIRKGVGIVIRNNTLQAYKAATDDPMNAAIQIGSALGDVPISGLVVEGNYMDGGNYTINGGSDWVTDAVYRDNTLGPNFRYGFKTNLGKGSRWESSNRAVSGALV